MACETVIYFRAGAGKTKDMEPKGFFSALFDFSFSEFITTKIIKFIYGLNIVIAGLVTLIMIFSQFGHGKVLAGIGMLIISPIAFLLWVCLSRIYLELVIVIFRIAENTRDIARLAQAKSGETPIPPPL